MLSLCDENRFDACLRAEYRALDITHQGDTDESSLTSSLSLAISSNYFEDLRGFSKHREL
jgi:hypothetical protein